MKKIIALGIVLVPQLLFAGTDCSVKEYPDHYLAECAGDEKAVYVPGQSAVPVKSPLLQDNQVQRSTQQPSSVASSVTVPAATQQAPPEQLKEANTDQKPTLSRRNQAKIQAAHMKELKRKAQLESTQ